MPLRLREQSMPLRCLMSDNLLNFGFSIARFVYAPLQWPLERARKSGQDVVLAGKLPGLTDHPR